MKNSAKPLVSFAALVLFAAVLQQMFFRSGVEADHVAQPLPELMTQGWVNTDAPPTRESLRGKWVIVSMSTLSCRTCRREAPLLARIQRAIAGRDDITLVGFDTDPEDAPDAVAEYVDSVPGLDWPVGVGAQAMAVVMEAPYSPTLFLFNPEGQSVWRGHFVERLAAQLKQRLGIDSVQFDGR